MDRLLDKDIIQQRIDSLEDAYASNVIEGIRLPDEDMEFTRDLIRKGATDDDAVKAIVKRLGFEPV